ncbi:MAG TPA: Wzz/FepE/Etk N-terminal domain-containing protein [Bryobacteraceae bacterium]|nr:Wzz/FepE/Etk N-terminal domain-containing protein [Bryobacteraceae bacterium]
MQPQESLTTSRRPLDIEDYIDILRRHKGWIFGPIFAALVVSVVVAFLWPDTYISRATIRVVPPQVPENLVPANVNIDIQGRVNSLAQTILNRATLTNIINTQGLYKKERERLPLDDIIENMRRNDIHVTALQQGLNSQTKQQYPAFEISFAYSERFTAQKVVNDLKGKFLEENVREQSSQTQSTTAFLGEERDTAKRKLDSIEQKLSEFRSRNLGRLPEEQQSNYQTLTSMQAQMLNINTAMNRINQDKLILESQLRILREQLASLKDPNANEQVQQQRNEKLAQKDLEISRFEDMLVQARQRYKDTHPDVIRLTNMLATAKKQRETLAKEEETKKPEAPTGPRPASPQFAKDQRDLDTRIKTIEPMIAAKDLEMDDYKKQAAQLAVTIKNYQARIEGVPVGIKEYDELIREKEIARRDYEDVDRRATISGQSTKLVNIQAAERLEELDPPNLPVTPTQPNRYLIVSVGTGLGLIIGLCLAGAREMKDTALKNLKDVRAYTQLQVLGSIPLLENDLVVRRRKRLAWLAWSTACLVGVAIMSSSVVYYFATKL